MKERVQQFRKHGTKRSKKYIGLENIARTNTCDTHSDEVIFISASPLSSLPPPPATHNLIRWGEWEGVYNIPIVYCNIEAEHHIVFAYSTTLLYVANAYYHP